MIKDYKNSIAALLDEGYVLEDLHDLLDTAKVEYDKAHRVALVDELAAVFDAHGVHMAKEPLLKFVNMSAEELRKFVNHSYVATKPAEEKCSCADTKPCDEKIVAKSSNEATHTSPYGKITVKTNMGNADEILGEWMKQLGF